MSHASTAMILQNLSANATRIPAFMYLTDFRENTLQDVITKIEPGLFQTVTGPAILNQALAPARAAIASAQSASPSISSPVSQAL